MLAHWIWLSTRIGVGVRGMQALLRQFPDVESLYFAEEGEYALLEELSGRDLTSLCDKSLDQANRVLEACYNQEIHLLTLQDAAYPLRLKNIFNPPVVLYYKGQLPEFDAEPVIAVVGTRKASAYGCVSAKRMGYQLGRCGALVVSGLAGGIDSMAMIGALTAGRPVIGVLGCGVDVVYPKSNAGLFRDVVERGCLLSEFMPGTPPERRNFPQRNRIISGLACGVVVVEAPAKSGALITAQLALDQGRDVFAVPGNIDVVSNAGSNGLLRQGAVAVQHGWDVMEEYEELYPGKIRAWNSQSKVTAYPEEIAAQTGERFHPVAKNSPAPSSFDEKSIDKDETNPYIEREKTMPQFSADEKAILSALAAEPRHVDHIIAETGLPAGRVLASLTLLEVRGYVTRQPGQYYAAGGRTPPLPV